MRKLWVRLSGAFLLVALAAVLGMAFFVSRAVETSFRGYVNRANNVQAAGNAVSQIEDYYAANATLEGAQDSLPGPGGHGQGQGTGGQGRGGVQFTIIDADGRIVSAPNAGQVGQTIDGEARSGALPLTVGGETVGWLIAESPGQTALNEAQTQFLSEVSSTLGIVGGAALLLALIGGVAFSQLLTRPLQRLTGAAQAIAGGDLAQQVAVGSGQSEEITTLAESFNRMSASLAESEDLRQRMTADVAHELRTPLSVIRGQLQSMLDGVRPATVENVAVVYDQTLHLTRLVEDLRILTQAEAGHLPLELRPVSPGDLVRRAAERFAPLAEDGGRSLAADAADDLPTIRADADRLQQVFANLLANALRHTNPGDAIRLKASRDGDAIQFRVSNTGVTLAPEDVDRVFERLWRADESRSRDRGGSGLGLSIARQIVRLHGGRIWAEVGDGQTHFVFELPLKNN
jgi:two-component system OmpR family sensor kinase/two-component system sensor histidine kinase BaeS